MGFHLRTLPPLDELISIRERISNDQEFMKLYWYKPDALTGPEESMSYMKQLIENEKRNNPPAQS